MAEESANGSSKTSAIVGKQLDGVRPEHELVMVGVVPLGDQAGVRALVERAFLEPDREGLHSTGALQCCHGRQTARVDPAREKDAHRNVGYQMRTD